jgi:outer membrane lipoprotein-sorting protein
MMLRQENWLRLIALTLLGVLATACSSLSSPTVDDIVASNLAARGGKQRIQALDSIRESGTVTGPGGRVAQVVREIKRPGLFRLEFNYQGTTSVFAHDGKSGWQVAPLQGQFEPSAMPPEADAAGGVDQRDIEGPLVDWNRKGHVVTLVGRESVDGKETFKLKVAMQGGAVRYDYVDVASRQIVRSDVTRLIRGHATVLQNAFSDFREVDGLVFPHVIETSVKDRPQVLRINVEKIELNPALDDARFRIPQ